MQPLYDQASPQSIESFGKRLVNKTLRTVSGQKEISKVDLGIEVGPHRRASFGYLVERFFYGINPDNNSGVPDFPEAGVELKTTPIKKIKGNRYSAKERLVLGLINYVEEASKDFNTSSFFTKNKKLMLISYLHEQGVAVGDLLIKIARLLDYDKLPIEDQKIIREDWEKINEKIRQGKAHELSEGDTLYLGACTKSADSSIYRQQIGDVPAKPRAYSFKSGYMTELVRRELEGKVNEEDRALKVPELNESVLFEDAIIKKFEPFIGKSVNEIVNLVGSDLNRNSKDFYAGLSRRMIGVKGSRVLEFDAAEISMKTIQLNKRATPKEHMSFPAFKYKELVNEIWDADEDSPVIKSSFQKQIERRFLLVIYQCSGNCGKGDEKRLSKVMFWSMPYKDRLEAKEVWKIAVSQIKVGHAQDMPNAKSNRVAHVRPHARNSQDVDETPDGKYLVKKSFWLNKRYLKEIIK